MNKTIYVVMDGENPVYCAPYASACHEHINDAIEMDIDEASKWVVRTFVMESQS